eukprot:Colp12_sorted_trinity150504_noHs@29849
MSNEAGSRIWFRLVDSCGQPYKGVISDAVFVAPGSDVAQLRLAVRAQNLNKLSLVDASDLRVFTNKKAFDEGKEQEQDVEFLKSSLLVDGFGKTEEEAVIIEVPACRPPTPPVLQDLSPRKAEHLAKLKNLIFYTCPRDNEQGCATAFSKHKLATYAHGNHAFLKVGDSLTVFCVVGERRHVAKVSRVDRKCDFILLECEEEVCSIEVKTALPYEGEEYFQLGLSARTQNESPFSVKRGLITSSRLNSNGHILGSAGANLGDSGGGCFAQEGVVLYGINVGGDQVAITESTTLGQLGTRYPSRAHILPAPCFYSS